MKAAVKPRGIIAGLELDFTFPLAEKRQVKRDGGECN